MRSEHAPVIGIDGGGTRCRLALLEAGERIELEVGPCNLSSDFRGGINVLWGGLDLLSDRAGRALTDVPTYCGLAGVVSDALAREAEAALPLTHVKVEEDRFCAVEGALGPGNGCVLHSGTGSFVAVRDNGPLRFAGGWGARLGDDGSAYEVGRAALRHAMAVFECRAAEGWLSRAIRERIGDRAAVIRFAAGASTEEVAALARLVTEAAANDPAADRVLINAAEQLYDVAKEIGLPQDVPICLTGGLGPHLASRLPERARHRVIEPVGTPLDGALSLAQRWISGATWNA